MGLFNKKEEEKEEIVEEEVKVTEKDKLTSYIRNKRLGTYREGFLLDTIKEHYVENTNSYEKCKDYIDFISEIGEDYIRNRTGFNRDLFFLYMSNDNSLIISAIIKLALHSTDCNYVSYLVDSRSYFSDNETWFARVYEVINNNIKPDTALEEDRMRLGIYPNLSNHKAEEISDMYHELFLKIKNNLDNVKDVETKLEKLKEETSNIKEDTVRLMFSVRIETPMEREQVAKVTGTNKDDTAVNEPKKRAEKKVQRNDPCPCGSGKKYKQCCGK